MESRKVKSIERVETATGTGALVTYEKPTPKPSDDAMLQLAETAAALECIEKLPRLHDDQVVLILNAAGMVTEVNGAEVKKEILRGFRGFAKTALQAQARQAEARIRREYGPKSE